MSDLLLAAAPVVRTALDSQKVLTGYLPNEHRGSFLLYFIGTDPGLFHRLGNQRVERLAQGQNRSKE